jgi:LAO/AO transport system kinase
VTGAPGTGKSTLVDVLAYEYRQRGHTVGVLAVDPSSPYTGGALLGDRIRMRRLSGDPGIFIRSMATRGAAGGLSRAAADTVQALDAAGYTRIFVETVGAGQDQGEIARLAHTVIVVEAPGLGDEIQAIKAGILETASVLVVNKADRDGAEQTIAALQMMLDLAGSRPKAVAHHGTMMAVPEAGAPPVADAWEPPLLPTVATEGRGIVAVLEAVEAHRTYLATSPAGDSLERHRAEVQLRHALDEALRRLLAERTDPAAYGEALEQIIRRTTDPHTAADQLVSRLSGTFP